jgi:hypothetical protein
MGVWQTDFEFAFELNLNKIGKVYSAEFIWPLMATQIVNMALTDDKHGQLKDTTVR